MGLHSSLYSKLEQLLVVAAVLLTIAYIIDKTRRFFIRRQFARRYGCQPVPRACNREPFLGLDIAGTIIRAHRQHKLLETINELFRLHKNTFTSKEFLRHVILTVEPENIKTILSTRFNDYGLDYRLEYFSPLLGKGIFDTDGDHWAASRALIRPNFTRDQVADLRAFERLISDLFSLVPRDGVTVVDLQDLFFRYTIDSATEFLFGQSVGSLKMAGSDLGFAYAFNYSQDNIRRQALFGPFRIFYRDPKADECNRICREFGQRFVDEAVLAVQREGEKKTDLTPEAKDQKYIFLQELSRRTSDKRRILDESMNVLLAGRDTTASLLSNMFFMLAKNPAMWAKLRKEVASLEGRPPTYEEIRNLKYLKCCMNESLRLHPVVPINERLANCDTVLPVGGGEDCRSPVFVPKGTMVGYNVYALHRRHDFYGSDAEEFRPERWEDGRLRPRWEFLPFNGGPRICVGQQYALTEVGYVTVRMAQTFRLLESRDPRPWEESLTLTLCSRNGTRVCLTPA